MKKQSQNELDARKLEKRRETHPSSLQRTNAAILGSIVEMD
jgi:hypothetical protein